jgi:hypothetical protein
MVDEEVRHVPLTFPRGIDHYGAWKSWTFFLFCFLVGVLIFSNYSLHSRLSRVESSIGISDQDAFLPKTGEKPYNTNK